jgi:signal transduction histidine kinase
LAEDQQQRQLQIIRRSAWRMERLIQDLLDVSRMEAGTFAVARERVDVVDLLSEIIESFDGQAISKNITLTCQPEPRIQPLHGDRDRLVQVMANLIGNALKFTPSGGNVAVRARAADLQVQISVEDNGPGIAPTNLGNVFERFWQADRAAGGAGLGLVIVKGIVEAHGGRISVESTLGKGTTFQVKLPLALHERRRA